MASRPDRAGSGIVLRVDARGTAQAACISRRRSAPNSLDLLDSLFRHFTDGILAGSAALFNPTGMFYVIASALPSTLAADAGLLSLPSMMCGGKRTEEPVALPRSVGWIIVGVVASLLFIFAVGRGLT